jgi:N-acetylmuramoyl-L-alanine amidase
MKIAINMGHTKIGTGTGAAKYLNESVETRKIGYDVLKLLADTKHEAVPVVFDKSSNNLKEAVDLANAENADLFLSVHLNAGGGQGCEAYTWQGKKTKEAVAVLNNLSKLGFKNRGVKNGSGLYVIKNTKMNAVLVEVCFVDSETDRDLFNKAGYGKIAKAIVDAL